MKKISGIILIIFLLIGCAGCRNTITDEKFNSMKPIEKTDFADLYSNPDKFKGQRIDFTGKVFSVEIDGDNTYLQIWQDPVNFNNNTVVTFAKKIDVAEDDYISISGIVAGKFSGTNSFGGKVTAPQISARNYEIIDYIRAVAPTTSTITVDKAINQHELIITLQKIEFSDLETRAYIKINNNTPDQASFYSFNSMIIQGNSQFEEQTNYEYEDIPSTIMPGVEVSGIVVFPKIIQSAGALNIQFESRTDDWYTDFDPYIFSGIQ